MKQVWRWFGPHDLASVDAMLQSGVEGVVSALHHIPNGVIWSPQEISTRQRAVRVLGDGSASGLEWEVVESLPVSEDIKKQKGAWREHIANYKISLGHLRDAGIETICYNFMPVLDWTRTDLAWGLPHGGSCMRYDHTDFAVFDVFILERDGARQDFSQEIVDEAGRRFEHMGEDAKGQLTRNITAGLPGSTESLSLDGVREHLAEYGDISADQLRANFIDFLEEVAPVAQEMGLRLCCHPDDPPFPMLGLPRVMSSEADYKTIMDAVDIPANGITLCSGSLGARPDNDLPGMMERLGDRVHFLHMRNVKRDTTDIKGSFYESEHLAGDVDMVAFIAAVLREEARRKKAGRADYQIPMRPDHGQDILDDIGRNAQPGYPTIGRMRGLAELRGIITALEHSDFGIL